MSVADLVVIQRLLLVMLLAGFIGFERERHGRAAGFRTHILVAIGSSLIMMTGLYLMEAFAGRVEIDPTRMAAQVVSGMGFLGAGTILRFRASIRGLTTAASLWAAAGIGLAVGAGFISGAVAATIIVFIVLMGLAGWERRMRRAWFHTLVVESSAGNEGLMQVRKVLTEYDVEIQDFELSPGDEAGVSRVELHLKLLSERDEDAIVRDVLRVTGTRNAHWA